MFIASFNIECESKCTTYTISTFHTKSNLLRLVSSLAVLLLYLTNSRSFSRWKPDSGLRRSSAIPPFRIERCRQRMLGYCSPAHSSWHAQASWSNNTIINAYAMQECDPSVTKIIWINNKRFRVIREISWIKFAILRNSLKIINNFSIYLESDDFPSARNIIILFAFGYRPFFPRNTLLTVNWIALLAAEPPGVYCNTQLFVLWNERETEAYPGLI